MSSSNDLPSQTTNPAAPMNAREFQVWEDGRRQGHREAAKPHWLDEPAIIAGEQVVLLDHFPLGVKIIFGLMIAMGVFVIGALVYGRITGAIS